MEIFGPSGLTAVTKPLMQLPDGITKPGKLKRTEIGCPCGKGVLQPDPVGQAASWVKADSKSFTRCRKPSRRTSFTVWVTRALPTTTKLRLASLHCLAS